MYERCECVCTCIRWISQVEMRNIEVERQRETKRKEERQGTARERKCEREIFEETTIGVGVCGNL